MKLFYLCFFLSLATLLHAQKPGTLDKTFGRNGRQWDTVAHYADFPAMVVQPDDKILIGGQGFLKGSGIKTFRIDRLGKNGKPDVSFGDSGTVLVTFRLSQNEENHEATVTALALQPDGKILACGNYSRDGASFLVMRFLTNGGIDSSFGVNGMSFPKLSGKNIYYTGNVMTVQTDGKILVGGVAYEHYLLQRLLPNGSLDSSFAGTGQIIGDGGTINAIALQTDGKILAAGAYGASNTLTRFLLRRYKTDGTPDKSFGRNGIADTAINAYSSYISDLAIQPDGKIVAGANSADQYGFYPYFTAARFTKNGKADNSFGTKGIVVSNLSSQPYGTVAYCKKAFLWNDKVILAGDKMADANQGHDNDYDLTMVAYQSNGKIDSSFATNGVMTADYDYTDYIGSAAMQSDGKLLMLGLSRDREQTYEVRNLLRYNGYSTQPLIAASEKGVASVSSAVSKLQVYPNPTSDYVLISGLSAGIKTSIVITDGLGKTVAVYQDINASQYRYNAGQLAPGIYYIQVKNAGNMETLKFIKR